MSFVYMRVSKDKYRLPEAVADTPLALARLCGVPRTAVNNGLSRARHGVDSVYVKVEIDDEEVEE